MYRHYTAVRSVPRKLRAIEGFSHKGESVNPFSHEIGSDRQQIFAGNFRQDNNMRACVIQPKSNHTPLHRNACA